MARRSESPVTLITGAGDYVGPALARLMAGRGHHLVLHGPGESLVRELESNGTEVESIDGVDLRTREGNQAVVAAALDRFGRLDAASFLTGRMVLGRFLEMTADDWERVKRANLDMVFHALQAAIPPMVKAGTGQIVVFTSATGARPEPRVSLYASTRAGANALVRAVGLEHARDGLCINAIGTNYMEFPGFLQASGADDPERRRRIEEQVPARRLGTMEELAEFTAVLLDGRSRFQTGQFFSYSGGWSA
ncbi:MAG: SDR family NAD(P)-dependent oxidoreductase [Dehalococcoidia bacterium]